MTSCVFCSTQDNLTFSMEVKTEHGVQKVHVCADHEDDASPKKIREVVQSKIDALKDLQKQAEELGYTIIATDKLATLEKKSKEPTPTPQPQAAPATSTASQNPKRRHLRTGGVVAPTSADAPAHASYDTAKDEAPAILEAEEQVVDGRCGIPTPIPKKIVSEAGVTEINIVNTGGDQALQNRFKDMAKEGKPPDFAHGYKLRQCGICVGTGIAKITGQTCPKCKGAGEL